jgi:hypothetical protein
VMSTFITVNPFDFRTHAEAGRPMCRRPQGPSLY